MKTHKPFTLVALLVIFMFQSIKSFSQDTAFVYPKGYIATMESREASKAHIIYLKKYYSECMIGDSLNINCAKIKQVVKLNLPFENRMVDLSWIKYFDNLEELIVNYNFISILPDTFPTKLKKLNLSYNKIITNDTTRFGVLPKGLTHLDVSRQGDSWGGGQLKKLPALPDSLKMLNVSYNSISSLPSIIPAKIVEMNISYNNISVLPASVAASTLKVLNASFNRIIQIDTLPASLEELDLYTNQIADISLIAFPAKLKYINLGSNKLTHLPDLNSVITTLNIGNNKFVTLPALPASLIQLDVHYNQLKSLPVLPAGLITLSAYHNELESLPVIPASLKTIYISENKISILPVLPSALTTLEANKNLLTVLPALPATLRHLSVTNNQISALPTLPGSIAFLNISDNLFTGTLSITSAITSLLCDNNSFTVLSLPALSVLEKLSFSNNDVITFPFAVMPASLIELYCDSNALKSIPNLTDKLEFIRAAGNVFTCLPNLPARLRYSDIRVVCNKNCWIPQSGNWNVASNWSSNIVPSTNTDVLILNGTVTITQHASVRNLDIRSSNISTRLDTAKTLQITGKLTGTPSSFYAEVIMAGSARQEIVAQNNFEKLTINNDAGVKLPYSIYINQLSVQDGYIVGNNEPIQIQKLGYCHSGTIVQNATIKTSVYSKTGWTFLTNNIKNKTFSYLNSYIEMGFGGSNQNVYKYNGELIAKNGWLPVQSTSEGFVSGEGYRVFSYRASEVVYNGVPFTGNKNYNVTHNTAGYDGGGWNLVGNPYMSPIDWDNSDGWNKFHIDNAIYIWDSNSGKYASYVNGASAMGGSSEIALGQAFFVKANGSNPNLEINELAKTKTLTASVQLIRKVDVPSLKIVLSDTKKVSDEILLRIVDGSTDAFDSEYDAHKLIGEGHNVSISGVDKLPLSISSVPLSAGSFPLEIEAEKTGRYTFSFEGIDKFNGTDIYLSDTYLDKLTLIEPGTKYPFTLESVTDASRFKIVMNSVITGNQNAQKTGVMKVYPNPAKENATVLFPNAVSGELVLTDASGNVVYTNTVNNTDTFALPLENYKGVYFLKVYTGESIFVTKIVKL